jgi:serine/threonine protein kinase
MPINVQRIQAVFLAAVEISDPADRARFLDGACGGDAELRSRVEALLRAHDQPDSLLDHPAVAPHDPDSAATQALTGTPEPGVAVTRTTDGGPADSDEEPLTFLSPPGSPDALGRLGHYEVLQVLGRGGFGIVFRAFDEMLQRVVALKVMAPQLAATSPARKRFLREARSSAQVRHENVVQVYEVAEQPLPYLAMEFIPGETLQQRLDRVGPLDVPEVLRIGRQIAEGLAAAHATDLIHRDIKPGNVLLEGGHGKVKITDFGLARAADDASISQSGIIAGTPMYMAPEQAEGKTLDQRADLFSLGSVLYQMVSGRPPFRANTTVAVLKRVAEDKPRPIREIIPETPQWLCDIIAKLHAKDPDDRYQSARELADVLADCETQLKANARLKDYSRIPRSKPQRSGRWQWVAAAAAVLLPILALALAEIAGVTHLWPKLEPTAEVTPKSDSKAEPKTALATGSFALAFDGKKSRVMIPSLKITEDHPLTVETWTVIEDRVDRHKGIDLVGNAGYRQGFALGIPPAEYGAYGGKKWAFAIGLKSPNTYVHAWEKQPMPQNRLIHLAGIYDGMAEIRFYVNGQLQSRTPAPDVKPSTHSLMRLGAQGDGENRFLGRMNEVRISKVARYDTNFTPAQRWEPDKATIALYHFDEGEGNVLKDSSGNGHHGEIVGATWVKADGSPISPPPAAKTPAVAPFTDADVQRIAALPAEEQVEEVRRELKRRNPGFDGRMETRIEGGVVTEFQIVTDKVTDIAPIRVFDALRVLVCSGTYTDKPNGLLADLTPLEGMNLAGLTHLGLWKTKVSDAGLAYFKDCKGLRRLGLGWTKVSDAGLANFKDCKNLTFLNLAGTKVSDVGLGYFKDCKNLKYLWLDRTQAGDAGLGQFKGIPLRALSIDDTGITDLTPLQGMALEEIRLTPKNIKRGLDIIRDMKSLKTIGIAWQQTWPAAEFWQRYDKGEFR